MTSIRITGTPSECADTIDKLRKVFAIKSVSRYYVNRGSKQRRVYVEI